MFTTIPDEERVKGRSKTRWKDRVSQDVRTIGGRNWTNMNRGEWKELLRKTRTHNGVSYEQQDCCNRHKGSFESLLTVYYGHVYPHLNYGILLWGNHSSAKSLFILQKRAIRVIHGAPPRTHCKPLFIKLGILTLPSMYVLASLLHVKRNINRIGKCWLSSIIHHMALDSEEDLEQDRFGQTGYKELERVGQR
ncbi:hypothetical protein C0J52_05007 [Blattella germanica]|nr:hypothetical protein C0J52_05007 [Blattella germanica]